MQFSIFKKNLDNWQGSSLVFGIFDEEIESQLENIKFIIDPKILLKKINQKKFKGEKGETLNLEFLDQRLETLIIIGLGKSTAIEINDVKNYLANIIRTIVDKDEKISILLPPKLINSKEEIRSFAESARLSAYKDNRFNSKRDDKKILQKIEFLNLNEFEHISFDETEYLCEGIELARRLVAAPTNRLTPLVMSIESTKIAEELGLEI